MNGFFGIIDTDTTEFERHEYVPSPKAVALIEQFREALPEAPPITGNTISLEPRYDALGVAPADAPLLSVLIALVMHPESADQQMVAATAIALLIKLPFFYIAGAPDDECSLYDLPAGSAVDAEIAFLAHCIDRYVLRV